MISGTIVLEDMSITFTVNAENDAKYTVAMNGEEETMTVDGRSFMAALGIALHYDGTPDYKVDYKDAEEAQPENPELRFIP